MNGRVYALSQQLVLQAVTLAVASDDAASLPIGNVIEERVMVNSYLANELLVDVVGGWGFFLVLPSLSSDLSLGSPAGRV